MARAPADGAVPAADQAAGAAHDALPLAAKLAAARRNGVVLLVVDGAEFWFDPQHFPVLDAPDGMTRRSAWHRSTAAARSTMGAATGLWPRARRRPPSYDRRQARRHGTPSTVVPRTTQHPTPPRPTAAPPATATAATPLPLSLDAYISERAEKRRIEECEQPRTQPPPTTTHIANPPAPQPAAPQPAAPQLAAPPTRPARNDRDFRTPPASPGRSVHASPCSTSSWADEMEDSPLPSLPSLAAPAPPPAQLCSAARRRLHSRATRLLRPGERAASTRP